MKKLINWFKGLFNSIRSKWNQLSPSVQTAFKHASAVVDQLVLVTNSKEAELLVALLLPKIGSVAFDALKKHLPQIAIILGVGKTVTLENTIEENILLIATYLKDKQGMDWASNADQLYKILTVTFADNEITFSEAQLIGKWVYDNVIVKQK